MFVFQSYNVNSNITILAVPLPLWREMDGLSLHSASFLSPSHRDGEPGGVGPGGAGLQDAESSRVPRISARPDADLLEERARGEAHVWVPAGLLGGLLHLHGVSVPARREPVNVHIKAEPNPGGTRTWWSHISHFCQIFSLCCVQHEDRCIFIWKALLILPTCTANVIWILQPGIPNPL